MFGEVVSEVVSAAPPVHEELTLFDAIFNPVKSHIHGLRTSLFDRAVADAGRACIVSLNGSGRLWVTHVMKDGAQHGGLLAVVEESAKFGFGGGRKDNRHNGGMHMDGANEGWRGGIGSRSGEWISERAAEEEDAAGTGASLFLGEVGGIAVGVEDHAAGVETKNGVGVGSTVVEQLGDSNGGGGGAVGLRGCERAKRNKHGRVDGTSGIQESADDVLEMTESRGVKRWRAVVGLRVLDGGPIGRGYPGVWGVLLGPRRSDMEEFDEGTLNVPGHGDAVDGACRIIPVESEPAIQRARPIDGDCIKLLQGVNEVLGVVHRSVLYAEVVDDEAEGDRALDMGE